MEQHMKESRNIELSQFDSFKDHPNKQSKIKQKKKQKKKQQTKPTTRALLITSHPFIPLNL